MKCENALFPAADQLASFFGEAESGPFIMVNLLKFKDKAAYPDGSDADLPGLAAYKRYSVEVAKLIRKHGGQLRAGGAVTGLMVGACDPMWDAVALVEYPSLAAFRDMVMSDEYRAIEVHRVAGLEGQINIKIKPLSE